MEHSLISKQMKTFSSILAENAVLFLKQDQIKNLLMYDPSPVKIFQMKEIFNDYDRFIIVWSVNRDIISIHLQTVNAL